MAYIILVATNWITGQGDLRFYFWWFHWVQNVNLSRVVYALCIWSFKRSRGSIPWFCALLWIPESWCLMRPRFCKRRVSAFVVTAEATPSLLRRSTKTTTHSLKRSLPICRVSLKRFLSCFCDTWSLVFGIDFGKTPIFTIFKPEKLEEAISKRIFRGNLLGKWFWLKTFVFHQLIYVFHFRFLALNSKFHGFSRT